MLNDYIKIRDLKPGSRYNYNCVVNAYLKDWLPLSDFLIEMLEDRSKSPKSEYVFPGEHGGRQSDPRPQVLEVTENSGVTFVPHDLRRTFATVAESRDLSWKTVKALLNHKMEDDVTAGYVVSEAERLRAAMQTH